MKLILLFSLLSLAAPLTQLHAQAPQATPPPPPPLPKGPIILPVGPIAQWLISITSGTENPVKFPDANTKFATRTVVRKAGSMRDELSVNAAGEKKERWCEGAIEASMLPGQTDPVVNMGSAFSPFNPNFTDYSKSDFPDLSWVSKHNYVGVQSVEGFDCYEFQEDVTDSSGLSNTAGAPLKVLPSTGKTAFVARQGQFPVVVDDNGVVSLYQRMTPDFTQITVPKPVQDGINVLKNKVQQISAPAAVP